MILDKLDKLASREKLLLGFAGLCVVVLLLDWLVIQRLVTRNRAVVHDIQRAGKDLEYNLSVLASRDEVARQYEVVKGLLREASSTAEEIDGMKGETDAMLGKFGIEFQSINHREPRRTPYYEEYTVDVGGFQADVENLVRFLNEIHERRQAPGVLRVAKLSVNPNEKGERQIKGSMVLTKIMLPAAAGSGPASP
jgi:hypothetical protein